MKLENIIQNTRTYFTRTLLVTASALAFSTCGGYNDGNSIIIGEDAVYSEIDENTGCQIRFYKDNDNDGFGSDITSVCHPALGYVDNNLDCNDNDPYINPAIVEQCDNIDNNCNGMADEEYLPRICHNGCGEEGYAICIKGEWKYCNAPSPEDEICDNKDNDCDGKVDENITRKCFSSCGTGIETCVQGKWENCTAPKSQPAHKVCYNNNVYAQNICGSLSVTPLEVCAPKYTCVNGECK